MTQWTNDPGSFPPSLDDGDRDAPWNRSGPAPVGAAATATERLAVVSPPAQGAASAPSPFAPPGAPFPAGPPTHDEFQSPPPPPLYPPLVRFPGDGAVPPAEPPRSSRRRTIALMVALSLVVAAVAFGIGRAVESSRSPSGAVGQQAGSSTLATTAGSASSPGTGAAPVAGQDGPVTQAPKLDPALAAEPAAAVNKAVSPAVVQIETTAGLGTGFIYDAQGYILTAAHVVASSDNFGNATAQFAKAVTVRLADGSSVDGEVLGSDLNNDVAVVKIAPRDKMPVAALALGEHPEVGSIAIAIGSPFGLDQTVTQGIVSAVNRPVPSPNNNIVSMIQTDAAINSGNSGGPLVNRAGKVIGINTQIRTDSGDNAGIGFAVPIDLAYDVAQSLIAGKPIQLGYLGVRGGDPPAGSSGAMVLRVEADSPAAKAGLQEGDVITTANGTVIRGFEELASIIRATAPGEKLTMVVQRDGATRQVEVTVGQATTR